MFFFFNSLLKWDDLGVPLFLETSVWVLECLCFFFEDDFEQVQIRVSKVLTVFFQHES